MIRFLVTGLIRLYQYLFSPWVGYHCRYSPTCSEYCLLAVQTFGVTMGLWLGFRRLLRCHPWHPGGCDPVPDAAKRKP